MSEVKLSTEVASALASDTSHVHRPEDPTFDAIEDECQWLSDSITTRCIQNHDRVHRMKAALSSAASEIRIQRRLLARIAREASR
jgi:hypothetical protein